MKKTFNTLHELNTFINEVPTSFSKIDVINKEINRESSRMLGHSAESDGAILAMIVFVSKNDYTLNKDKLGVNIDYDFHTINAIRAYITVAKFQELKQHQYIDFIDFIDENEKATPFDSFVVGDLTYTDVMNWAGKRSRIDKAWNRGFTGEGVKVAVIDTNMVEGHSQLNYTRIFFAEYSVSPEDDFGGVISFHGHYSVATIGAALNNEMSVGMAPGCDLYGLNTDLGASKMEAYQWCIDNNMDIVSMSYGSYSRSNADQMIMNALVDNGALVIAGGGNDDVQKDFYPANYDNVISVGAVVEESPTTPLRAPYWVGTNRPYLDFVYSAGSVYVPHHTDNNVLYPYGGTSCATPSFAGFMACLKQEFPTWSNKQLIAHAKKYSFPVPKRYGVFPYYYRGYPQITNKVVARIFNNGDIHISGPWVNDTKPQTFGFGLGLGMRSYGLLPNPTEPGVILRIKNNSQIGHIGIVSENMELA